MFIKFDGIYTGEYNQALITQLTDPLIPKPLRYVPIQLQIASLEALQCVMDVCTPRIDAMMAGTIADAVCRCWIMLSRQNGQVSKPGNLSVAWDQLK